MRSTVHFASVTDVVEIPRRSAWKRKWKPIMHKCCSNCYAGIYILCYPCIEIIRFCSFCCKSVKEGESTTQPVATNHTAGRQGTYPTTAVPLHASFQVNNSGQQPPHIM